MTYRIPWRTTEVILLGDHDTAGQMGRLTAAAEEADCAIAAFYSFAPEEVWSSDDLADVEAVTRAVGCAIASRMDVWVPFARADLTHERHWRRLSMVLQRHGLNLRIGGNLAPCPTSGGYSEIDFALRREVRAVDALDQAALACSAVHTLSSAIEADLVRHRDLVEAGSRASAKITSEAGATVSSLRELRAAKRGGNTPVLPNPGAPWPSRQAMLRRYALWLVDGCGVTQAATARVLNSAGQRTPTGRQWRSGTVSALLNGRYDRDGGERAGGYGGEQARTGEGRR